MLVNDLPNERNEVFKMVAHACMEARRNYRVLPIPGKFVVLASQDFSDSEILRRWEALTTGELTYEVFADTTHKSLLLDKENSAQIAERLKFYLDQLYSEEDADTIL